MRATAPVVALGVARLAALYLLTATLLAGSVVLHEYAHYAAHEGLQPAPILLSHDEPSAESRILRTEAVHAGPSIVQVRAPGQSAIVLFDDLWRFSLSLGLAPSSSYEGQGALAATYLRVQPHELADGAYEVPEAVDAAPVYVAFVAVIVSGAWAAARPSLFSRALFLASALQVGCVAHHGPSVGLTPGSVQLLCLALSAAAVAVAGLRSRTFLLLRARSPLGVPAGAGRFPVATARAAPAATTASPHIWMQVGGYRGWAPPARVRAPHEIAWRSTAEASVPAATYNP